MENGIYRKKISLDEFKKSYPDNVDHMNDPLNYARYKQAPLIFSKKEWQSFEHSRICPDCDKPLIGDG